MNDSLVKTLAIVGVTAIIYLVFTVLFQKDIYTGFFYPNASVLSSGEIIEHGFETLDECRNWATQLMLTYPQGTEQDYECGLNCDLTGFKPYICEETGR